VHSRRDPGLAALIHQMVTVWSDYRQVNTFRLGASQGRWPVEPTEQVLEDFRQRAARWVLDSRRSLRNVAAELGDRPRNRAAAQRRQRADGPVALSADE
jgi:hypothetical protein